MNEAPVGFQCPQCFRTVLPVRAAVLASSRGYVTNGLIAINVAVFTGIVVLGGAHAALGSGTNLLFAPATTLSSQLSVVPLAIAHGQYWRLITAMFVHFGLLHLAANMWALWTIGHPLERVLGSAQFAAVYLLCGLGGDIAAYLPGSVNSLTGGASTALFGLFAVTFMVNRTMRVPNTGLLVLIALNLWLTFAIPNISIIGHLGGLVTGVLTGFGVTYQPQAKTAAPALTGIAILLVVLVVVRTATLL